LDDRRGAARIAKSAAMSWRQVSLSHSLGEFRATWDALNTRYYNGHPFNDSRFVEPLLNYFGTGRERLFIHHNGTEIDGLMILVPGKPGVWHLFMPAQLQAAPLSIPHANLIDDVFRAMPRSVQMLELLNQDPEFAPTGLFDGKPNRIFLPHALTMNVALEGDFEAYWAGRSRKVVQNLRRYERSAVKEFGGNRLLVIDQPSEISSAVSRYASLESKGWKGKEGTALHPENEQGQFYLELMREFSYTGQARVAEFWMGNHLTASRLMISGGGIEVMLKTTYDETLSQVAPGRLLLKQFLQHAFSEKTRSKVEFYTNATQDQLAWATGQRVISHISVFRFAWQARLYARYQRFNQKSESASESIAESQIEVLSDLASMPKSSQSLLGSEEPGSFDLGADWFGLLETSALTRAETPRYYVSTRDNAARCVLPLLVRGKQVTGLTTFYTSLFRPAMGADTQEEEVAAVFRHVVADTHAWSIRLDAMDPEHHSFTLLQNAMHQAGLTVYTYFSFGNWYLPVNNRSFDVYLAGLSSQTRNTLKRKERKFLASGVGKIEIFTNLDGLEPAIAAWVKVYTSSWKKPEPFPQFMPNLIRLCAKRGWLRMGVAYYNQSPVAAQIWIVNGGRAAIYKLAYDEGYTQHSAGTILTAHLMRHVLDVDKVDEVDYLIGDDEYKKDWVSNRRERWGIVGYNPRTLRGLVGLGIQQLGALQRRSKTQRENT
jgi:CelD/BcsL family acetyltransferase involved in cellulose biosynthesis